MGLSGPNCFGNIRRNTCMGGDQMSCCNHDCDQGRECDERDKPIVTFDSVVGLMRDLLAGVGVVTLIIAIGFWSAK